MTGNKILSSYGTTIFEVMSQLALEHDAINLGQGFPDGNGPSDVVSAASDYLNNGLNQYPSMMGLPALRQSVAEANMRFYNLAVDWKSEILVTSGATEALAVCLFGLIDPGDKVLLMEPLYDSYMPIVKRAGGVPTTVRLTPPDWSIPFDDLERALIGGAKLVLLNTPMNPCSKVFLRSELEKIAALLEKYNAIAICDEVYEHLVYQGAEHIPLMTLPEMRNRSIRIGSAGKTFSLTGWKVGYITACAELMVPLSRTHQFLTFTTPPNLQAGAAFGLKKETAYFFKLSRELEKRRDQLANGLSGVGMEVLKCDGTYFLTADFRGTGFKGDDLQFCKYITEQAGVAAVPVSAFYEGGDVKHFARFCFCKEENTLSEAVNRLQRHFDR
ncbi:MAG: aminotransferase [Pseudomonadota bacterium]|nr:aminotransferase [Pseudomonadota bacterium]